ncbi:hypothetical protein H0H92_013133, partial [Tricholoma furcatifolium]
MHHAGLQALQRAFPTYPTSGVGLREPIRTVILSMYGQAERDIQPLKVVRYFHRQKFSIHYQVSSLHYCTIPRVDFMHHSLPVLSLDLMRLVIDASQSTSRNIT